MLALCEANGIYSMGSMNRESQHFAVLLRSKKESDRGPDRKENRQITKLLPTFTPSDNKS